MTPKTATTRGGKRFYSWRNENYWSVTTIQGAIAKPALLPWGIKATAEGTVKNRVVLNAMLERCQTPKACMAGDFCDMCDETIRFLKGTPYAQRDRAADLGTNVHAAAEAYILGKPYPPWPVMVKPYMDAYVRFLDVMQPKFLATEASVYNSAERYSGTLDAIVELQLPLAEPGSYILDVKSGKGVYPEVGLQLAAYRFAEFIGLPDGSEQPVPEVDGGLCLHLQPEGYRLIEVRCDLPVFRAFLYAREVFRWLEDTSKTVLGTEYTQTVEA